MSMHQIFLPDDVKYSCFGDDDFKREDELILLERDEWLEIESPSFSHPTVFDNVRSTTTFNSKQKIGWYTNETSRNRLLLQEINISVNGDAPMKSVWAVLPSSPEKGKKCYFPCFLTGSVLSIVRLGQSSLQIPLQCRCNQIFSTFCGILLGSEQGKLSLLHHIEEPDIPVKILQSQANDDAMPGTIIWASPIVPLIMSYMEDMASGKITLWHLEFEKDQGIARLRPLKERNIIGLPDIHIANAEDNNTKYLIINHANGSSGVLVWPLLNLSIQNEFELDLVFKKLLPIQSKAGDSYLLALKVDSSMCICSLDGIPLIDLKLVKYGGMLVLVPSNSIYPTFEDKFQDMKDISGCNVTVVLSSDKMNGNTCRVQLSWLPMSCWMRNNIDPSYFPMTTHDHLRDWSFILGFESIAQDEKIELSNSFEVLKQSDEHAALLNDLLSIQFSLPSESPCRSPLYNELSLNSLDSKIADLIMLKGDHGFLDVLKGGESVGQRIQTFSEINKRIKEFLHACKKADVFEFDSSRFLKYLLNSSWTLQSIDKLPFHLAIPLLILLEVCALDADLSHSVNSLYLGDRLDLAAAVPNLALDENLYNPFHTSVLIPEPLDHETGGTGGVDGVDTLQPDLMAHRFGRDTRVFEARELLSSSIPISLHSNDSDETGEGSFAHQKQLHLASKRTLALAVGRGAMALCTSDALPTELLDSPDIDLSGRIIEKNDAIVTLDLTTDPGAIGGGALSAKTAWPEFHNGVASALRIHPGGELSRTWIVYNKPENPSYDHAGFLLGLGLTGQLSCLTVTDLYRYLSHEHDATLVGILLGMSSSKRCSMDSTLTKILFLHLPARHPIGYPDLEISPVVQCSALVGLGQLYQGSSQRAIMETLLQEIERTSENDNQNQKQVNDITKGNEAYSLCAGFALGLVCLGKGPDQDMEAKLHYLLVGGTRSGNISRKSTLSKVNSSSRYNRREDFINEMIASSCQSTRSSTGQSSGAVAEELAAAQGAAKTIMEGDLINLNATSPAAALALGLMYLKSGNQRVAEAFYIPESLFGMRMVNPEHLCLRIAMRTLIMWDSIEPSSSWLDSQLPRILAHIYKDFKKSQFPDSDSQVVFQGSCFAVTGCCLGLGLRFAGTQNLQAMSLIEECLQIMMRQKSHLSQSDAHRGILEVLETCITSLIMSLSVVMAGSGDLRVFSLCRALLNRMPQKRNDESAIFYGSYIGASLSIGFLFLSGGAKTFGTSKESVAYLLMSIFPILTASTTDNKAYLQPLRHLYVLSTRQRITDCISIRSSRYIDEPLQTPSEGDGPRVVYVPGDLGDPTVIHAIRRSFEGFSAPEIEKILNRIGTPPSVVGYIHSLGHFSSGRLSMLSCGDLRICALAQPRFLCHLLKLMGNGDSVRKENIRKQAIDLWLTLTEVGDCSSVAKVLADCRKSLEWLCVQSVLR